ncbi:unnamed protein product [Lampetra planeri]
MPPATGRDRRVCGKRLANLLSAVAVLVAEMELDEPAERIGGPETREMREARETQLAQAAAILSGVWDGVPAIAVYPKMDKDGLDALVLDRMLGLARDLDIVLPASDKDDLTSLKVARCLQAYLNIKRHSMVAACTGPAEEGAAPDEVESSQTSASLDASRWRRAKRGQRDDRDRRTGASSGPGSSPIVCFKCGLPPKGEGRCKPHSGELPQAMVASADTLPPDKRHMRDRTLGLTYDEWGQLQMEDASLLKLRHRIGGAMLVEPSSGCPQSI